MGGSHSGHVLRRFAALLQKILRHDQQRLAVGQACILIDLPQQAGRFQQRHGSRFGGGFKG